VRFVSPGLNHSTMSVELLAHSDRKSTLAPFQLDSLSSDQMPEASHTTSAPPAGTATSAGRANTDNLGFLLAKASTAWNAALAEAFAKRGFAEVRPAYGSVLLPLFEQDGLRMGELCERARLSKQTMTTLIAQMQRDGLVRRIADGEDARARRVLLTSRAREFRPVAEEVLADLNARVAEHLSPTASAAIKRGLRRLLEL
jgi:DNA-binding MarR family transcriptional regulator